MAITARQANEFEQEKYDMPFSEEELKTIKEIEDWIDEKIIHAEDCSLVRVNLQMTTFHQQPKQRQEKMKKELYQRYENNGWKLDVDLDDGLDGPNRSGSDYLILKAK